MGCGLFKMAEDGRLAGPLNRGGSKLVGRGLSQS